MDAYSSIAMMDCHRRTEFDLLGLPSITSIGAPLVRIEDHKSPVLSCEFHHTGQYFLSSDSEGLIHVCNIESLTSKKVLMKGHTGAVTEAHFSKDGLDIYSSSEDRTIGIWDAFLGVRTGKLEGHVNRVNSVQETRSGYSVLCSGSSDGTVGIWDVRERYCALTLVCGTEVTATSFGETGEYVFSGGLDKDIKIWDLRNLKVVSTLDGLLGPTTGLSLSPCGALLLSHSLDNILRIWDVRPYVTYSRCVRCFHVNPGYVQFGIDWKQTGLLRCAWSPDQTMISGGTLDCVVNVWDIMTGEVVYKQGAHERNINDVAFHPKEPIILTASNDNFLFLNELIK